MQKVKVITHSGCDLPDSLARQYNIAILPDLVIFNDREFRNNVDIFPEEFYSRLEKAQFLPTSAHPSLAEFMSAFEDASQYEEIICISISSKMSSTIDTIKIAANMLAEDGFAPKIYPYDSYQVSFGMGIVALEAARMAMDGACAKEILARLDAIVPRIGVYFVMQSLKYAHKGGRIGAIKAVTADALGLKPLLQFRGGTVSDLSVLLSFHDAVSAIFKKIRNLAGRDAEIFIFHAYNEPDALRLRDMILLQFPDSRLHIELVGPVVGIYTGTGCVGVAFIEKEP